jgi:hypothetical protein
MRGRKLRPYLLADANGRSRERVPSAAPRNLALGIILGLLVTVAVFSLRQTRAQFPTGIEGVITIAPIRPGPIKAGAEIPTSGPLPNAVFTVAADKAKVTSFATDSEGRFRVFLKPGHYLVSLAEQRFPRPCGPFDVDVESTKMTKVEWRCDTGMR